MSSTENGIAEPRAGGYRPEIDGLRAIAVLAVMLFHARVRGFSGGFVGVDIFLVISGYLIAQLILRESAAGSFTLIGFYERRVRRILPALLAMLIASGLAGLILLPIDFRPFGESLTAISLFASNLLFWNWGGYFTLTEDATPLLHTWSLAVEEQFYILFPALLLLARRGGQRMIWASLAAAALGSFAYSVWATHGHAEAAFYSPLSRAWEFLAGALLASAIVPTPRRAIGDIAAVLGIVLIAHTILHLHDTTFFPGVEAVAPVLGSVLMLFGSEAPGSRVGRVLAMRPLAAIGLISYSLYLWHWPLIVFGGYYAPQPYGLIRIAMALLAFPVAWLSWRYVELPFRKPRLLLSRRTLFISAVAASSVLALYGVAIWRANGFPGRFDQTIQRLSERQPQPDYGCANRSIEEMRTDTHCLIGGGGPRPSFVLWGDSHAAVYFPALDALARRYRVSGYDAAWLGCPPLIPIRARDNRPEKWMLRAEKIRQCDAHNKQVMQFVIATRPRVVLVAAEWGAYSGGKHALAEAPDISGIPFRTSVEKLRALGIHVYVVQDVPSATLAEPRALAKAHLTGRTIALEPDLAAYLRRDTSFRAMTSDLQRRGLIEVIEPALRLCDRQRCHVTENNYPIYYDSNHLSARGAFLVAPIFEPMMRFLAAPPSPPARNWPTR
ncbi:acyltransferase family protein [Sphingomonas oligophenolica]|uniref:Acyltransferase family protein n=1 Tax=Sphingomonas oligophenolica TaxID=301154 RepID=A0ABU9Y5M5_9SPHN